MGKSLGIAIIVVFFVFVGVLANALGITTDTISQPNVATPADASFFEQVMLPFVWAFNAVGSLFQLMTFQVSGVPTYVNLFVLLPISFVIFYIIVRLVRGGG